MLVMSGNIDEAIKILRDSPEEIWSIDLETYEPFGWFHECTPKTKPLNRIDSKIASLQIATPSGIELYFNFDHKDGDLEYEYLVEIFSHCKSKELIAHNFSFEFTLLYNHGCDLSDFYLYDTMVMGVLLNENMQQGLKPAIKTFFKHTMPSYKDTVGDGNMKDITGAEGYEYGMSDATWTLKLFELYKSKINMEYYETFEMGIPEVASKLYLSGQNIDWNKLDELRLEDMSREQHIISENPDLKGINFNSPKQISNLLFNVLRLPIKKVGKTGQPSTDKETLNTLILNHGKEYPLLEAFSEVRAIETREKLYYKAYPKLKYPDNRIHSELRQTGTVTGRFSMSSPNLQQVSKRGEGVKVRSVFVPNYDKGEDIIVAIDWSQIELRMAGHLSQDPKLLDAYNTGKDLHTVSGTNILDCSYEEMKERLAAGDVKAKKARQKGKTLNFAALYGASPKRLAKFDLLDCTEGEAEAFLQAHKMGYSGYFYDYWNEQVSLANERLWAKTMFGRTRHLPDLASPIKAVKSMALNKIVNSIVQGSCAELMKISMVSLHQEGLLFNDGITFVGPIHDEFVFSMRSDMAEEYIPRIKAMMEITPKGFTLPLEAAASVGLNFADQIEIDDHGGDIKAAIAAAKTYKSKGN